MIWSRRGGPDTGPQLVLLHGLGATAEVYDGLVRVAAEGGWPGGWLAVDLPGHGRSDWTAPYSFARHADAVVPLVDTDRDVVLLGHSMGGVVALELAGRVPRTRAVVGFGIKVGWPAEHVEGARRAAARPPQVFATREEAAERYLRLAGLTGLVTPDDPAVDAGLAQSDGGWRAAQDPATFGVGVPDVPGLLAAVTVPVTLARGEHDGLVSDADLDALAAPRVTWPGLGHNAHVEDPATVLGLVVALTV